MILPWNNVFSTVQLLFDGRVNTSTANGRARERYRRVVLSAITSAMARGVNIVSILIGTPILLKTLGNERYGLYFTLMSLLMIAGFTDLGIGNGLINELADANGREDSARQRNAVASAFAMLTIVAMLLSAIALIGVPITPWPKIFNVQGARAVSEARDAAAVFAALFICSVPVNIVQRVLTAKQEAFVWSIWSVGATVINIGGILVGAAIDAPVVWFVTIGLGTTFAASLGALAVELIWRKPYLRPTLRDASMAMGLRLLGTGSLFFIMQVVLSVTMASDSIVISQFLGASEVANYAVPYRLFAVVPMLAGFVLSPLWPAYAEAKARGDVDWIRRTLRRSMLIVGVTCIVVAGLIALSCKWLLAMWVGSRVVVDAVTVWALAGWAITMSVSGAFSMLLNGLDRIAGQAALAIGVLVVSIGAKILLVPTVGVSGVVLGNLAGYLFFSLLPLPWMCRKYLRKVEAGA